SYVAFLEFFAHGLGHGGADASHAAAWYYFCAAGIQHLGDRVVQGGGGAAWAFLLGFAEMACTLKVWCDVTASEFLAVRGHAEGREIQREWRNGAGDAVSAFGDGEFSPFDFAAERVNVGEHAQDDIGGSVPGGSAAQARLH